MMFSLRRKASSNYNMTFTPLVMNKPRKRTSLEDEEEEQEKLEEEEEDDEQEKLEEEEEEDEQEKLEDDEEEEELLKEWLKSLPIDI